MNCYSLFGQYIHSDVHIPELSQQSLNRVIRPDIVIKLGNSKIAQTTTGKPFQLEYHHKDSEDSFQFIWHGIGCYTIKKSGLIFAEPDPLANLNLFHQGLYGVAVAVVLLYRGHLILHGTSVMINGRAYVVMGKKRQGKSTLAASLMSHGHRLISDDITTVFFENDCATILPGTSVIRLWSNLVPKVILLHATHSFALGSSKKIAYFLDNFTVRKDVPLGGLIILKTGPNLNFSELSGQQKIMSITTENYFFATIDSLPARFQKQIISQSGQLAVKAPAWIIERPHDAKLFDATVDLIEKLACQK